MAANNAKQRSASTVHDLRQLRRKVYECLFLMNKADRIVYGNRLADYAANTAMWFIRSYEEREAGEKLRCAREAAMWFSVFREDLAEDIEANIIKFPKRKVRLDVQGKPVGDPAIESVSSRKIDLVELTAKVDNGIGRWVNSLSQGQDLARCAPTGQVQGG